MPNIEVVGFCGATSHITTKIEALLRERPDVAADAIITQHFSACTLRAAHTETMPYVRVASTNPADFERVAVLINKELHLDVEWLPLGAFLEGGS